MPPPREIISDTIEPATPREAPSSMAKAAAFPHDGAKRSSAAFSPNSDAGATERSSLLVGTDAPLPPFRETPPEHRRGLWPIRASFFLGTVLLFVSVALLILIGFSSVHPAIAAALPTHRGSTLLPAWAALLSAIISLLSLMYFANPKWHPVRTAEFFGALNILCSLIMLLFVAIDPDNRTRESGLTLCMLGFLLVTLLHAFTPPRALPQTALQAYEQRQHRSWLRSAFSVMGVTLPLFILHIVLFAVVLLMTFDLAVRTHDAGLSPMGELIDVKPQAVASGKGLFDKGASLGTVTFRVHLWCQGGHDQPGTTVLLESDRGHPGTAQGQWAVDSLANDTDVRVCRWDRPAYGFSDAAPSSELPYVAQSLHLALHNSGELARVNRSRGMTIVANGYGGFVTRIFANQHPSLVHSIVFADAETELTNYPGRSFTLERFFRKVVPDLSAPLGIRPLIALILYPSQRAREARILSTARDGLSSTMPRARLQEHRALSSGNSLSARILRAAKRSRQPPARHVVVLSQAWRLRDSDSPWAEGQDYLARSIVGDQALVDWIKVGERHRPSTGALRRTPLCETDSGRKACAEALDRVLRL